jgi:predicted MPP superfamily phosphohydrolase
MNVSRRDFLCKGGLSIGSLMATSMLPALADDPSVFPERGQFERLSLQFYEIDAGATKPFTLLHISDTHLTAAYSDDFPYAVRQVRRRTKTFGGRQEEALRDSIAWAKEHVDYLVHTGDLIDWQSRANFDLVKKYFGKAGPMMFGCIGNHEHLHGLNGKKHSDQERKAAFDQMASSFPFDVKFSSTVVNGVNFITIDNSVGPISADQARRFEAEVKKGLPIILCMHCPFVLRGVIHAGKRFWRGDKRYKLIPDLTNWREDFKKNKDFVAYLRAQPLLKGILCGHGHCGVVDQFSPTAKQYMVGANFFFHGNEFTIR